MLIGGTGAEPVARIPKSTLKKLFVQPQFSVLNGSGRDLPSFAFWDGEKLFNCFGKCSESVIGSVSESHIPSISSLQSLKKLDNLRAEFHLIRQVSTD
jgi:hypothetical protein